MLTPPRQDDIARKSGLEGRIAGFLAGRFTHAEKAVLVSMVLRYNPRGFEIAEGTIAAESSLARSTVRRTVRALVSRHVLARFPGRGHAKTLWFLNLEPANAAATREFIRFAAQRALARVAGWDEAQQRRQASRSKLAMEARQAARAARPRDDGKGLDDFFPDDDDDDGSPFDRAFDRGGGAPAATDATATFAATAAFALDRIVPFAQYAADLKRQSEAAFAGHPTSSDEPDDDPDGSPF